MNTIWKFPLTIGKNVVKVPDNSEVLTVQVQDGSPCLWFLVDINEEMVDRQFEIFGTGHDIGDEDQIAELDYVGTFQLPGFVGHVFERIA